MTESVWASPITKDDTIHFIAPSKAVEDDDVTRAKAFYQQYVSKINVANNVFADEDDLIFNRLAGNDDARIQAVNEAFADPDSKAAMALSGGFGATRILRKLDFEALKAHPKLISGFSDITALHLAVYTQTGLVSLHSPNLTSIPLLSYTQNAWLSALQGNLITTDSPEFAEFLIDGPLETWHEGKVEGVLLGGNLSLVAALEGTPFALPKDRDIVLFLEEIGERADRVDLLLYQLLLAGSFKRVKGMVLGYFTKRKTQKDEPPDLITQVLQEFCKKLDIPVLANFPVGHVKNNLTVAHGAHVSLDASKQSLRYIDCPW
jgi:muramoyltetrapeptide carboxypeptidase